MDINVEIDEILRKKGVTPPHLTQREFYEKFFRRFEEEFPRIVEAAANRITSDIGYDELVKVGRGAPCRYLRDKKLKHCSKPPDCYTCLNYKPVPGWRRWLKTPTSYEFFFIGLAISSFSAAITMPTIRPYVLCGWFGIVIVSRLHIYWLYKKFQEIKNPRQSKK